MAEENMNLEQEFYRIQQNCKGLRSFIFGAITDDGKVPQIGVSGNGFDVIILVSALIRNLAAHVDDSYEGILGTVYEILKDVEGDSEVTEGKKS